MNHVIARAQARGNDVVAFWHPVIVNLPKKLAYFSISCELTEVGKSGINIMNDCAPMGCTV